MYCIIFIYYLDIMNFVIFVCNLDIINLIIYVCCLDIINLIVIFVCYLDMIDFMINFVCDLCFKEFIKLVFFLFVVVLSVFIKVVWYNRRVKSKGFLGWVRGIIDNFYIFFVRVFVC